MAGFGESLGWGSNPWYRAFDANRSALVSGFAGLGAASPRNIGGGFAQGFAMGMPLDEQRAERAAEEAKMAGEKNATKAYLEQAGFTDLVPLVDAGQGAEALSEAFRRSQPADPTANQNDYLFAKSNGYEGSFEDWMSGGSGGTEYGLTPIWGQMPDGTFAYGVQGKDGSFRPVDTGDMTPLDPRTLAGERAFGSELGEAQGAAVAGAPGDITTAQTALDLVSQIRNHPERGWATGPAAAAGMNNPILAPGRFAFQNLVDQAKSGAFLTAIQEMRGMGALSNAEGQTATQAITRMDTALSEKDFLAALADYERIVTNALQRAQGRLGTGPNVGAMPSASGQVLTYNPATGRLE